MAAAGTPPLTEKGLLRRSMRARRASLAPEERLQASRAACASLRAFTPFVDARVIAAFVAFRDEIDPREALVASPALVLYPRVTTGRPRLSFHGPAPLETLSPGAYGILEPPATLPALPLRDIDLFLLPGLAFDTSGRRLGYGGGYYDEVAAAVRQEGKGILVGLGFDFQLVDLCPAGEDDIPIDYVITDQRVVRCGAA